MEKENLESELFNSEVNERKPFEIDTQELAEWGINKVIKAQQRINQRESIAKEYFNKIHDWLDRSNKEDLQSINFLGYKLEIYARPKIENQKSNTLKLINGDLSFRKNPDSIIIVNEETAIAYCKKNNIDAIKVKESLLKTELEKHDNIPGVMKKSGHVKFAIKSNDIEIIPLLEGPKDDGKE
jgi:hypothetical protein